MCDQALPTGSRHVTPIQHLSNDKQLRARIRATVGRLSLALRQPEFEGLSDVGELGGALIELELASDDLPKNHPIPWDDAKEILELIEANSPIDTMREVTSLLRACLRTLDCIQTVETAKSRSDLKDSLLDLPVAGFDPNLIAPTYLVGVQKLDILVCKLIVWCRMEVRNKIKDLVVSLTLLDEMVECVVEGDTDAISEKVKLISSSPSRALNSEPVNGSASTVVQAARSLPARHSDSSRGQGRRSAERRPSRSHSPQSHEGNPAGGSTSAATREHRLIPADQPKFSQPSNELEHPPLAPAASVKGQPTGSLSLYPGNDRLRGTKSSSGLSVQMTWSERSRFAPSSGQTPYRGSSAVSLRDASTRTTPAQQLPQSSAKSSPDRTNEKTEPIRMSKSTLIRRVVGPFKYKLFPPKIIG